MLFRVLGDVGRVGDAPEVTISAGQKRRALMALLVLHAPRVVGRTLILESLWGDKLPDHPESALQVAVSRLRAELGPYGDHVVTESTGYRLDVDLEGVDIHCAEALLRDGRGALANNDATTASTCFADALALWTADPLEEFAESPYFRDARARIAELRFALVEARNDAYLASGRHLEVSCTPIKELSTGKGGVVTVLHDVTGIHEVEQARSDFVSMVSHELRTPLTSIKAYVDTLRRRDVTFDDETRSGSRPRG